MTQVQLLERSGTQAVKKLRKSKLARGRPFMINDSSLPQGQCYLEYPDGHIDLVKLSALDADFDVIRSLSAKEAVGIKEKYHLL